MLLVPPSRDLYRGRLTLYDLLVLGPECLLEFASAFLGVVPVKFRLILTHQRRDLSERLGMRCPVEQLCPILRPAIETACPGIAVGFRCREFQIVALWRLPAPA